MPFERSLGYDVQYFAAVEPQRRLAPHIHIAIRGTLSRTELRQALAATYHQVWWPDTSIVRQLHYHFDHPLKREGLRVLVVMTQRWAAVWRWPTQQILSCG